MQLWVTLGFVGVLGSIAIFLIYFIGSALNAQDTERIDEVPDNHFTKSI